MAPEDLAILGEIGKWWSVNGESIRGTTRTPLMRQAWGDTTLKGNSLYLHVFDWPKDGKLVVGGLKADVESAVLLSNRDKKLSVKRNGLDLEIDIPKEVPDQADSVILVQCKAAPTGDSAFLLQDNIPNNLSVFFAELLGKTDKAGWRLNRGQVISSNVTGWTKNECGVKWASRLNQKTKFDVVVKYDAPVADKTKVETEGGAVTKKSEDTFGGTFVVEIGNQKLKGEITKMGDAVEINLGSVVVEAGELNVQVLTETITGKELMRLRSVTLTPQK